jgi:translation elongation factor EF-1alpha
MSEKEAGKVIHYYGKAMVAVVRLSGDVKLGDAIKIAKGDSESEQKVGSMQINHEPVEKGKKGDEVAIKVDVPAKEGAVVYKVKE